MAVHAKEISRAFTGAVADTVKPSILIYGAYFALCALAINTTFLVFENSWLKFIFLPSLIFGYIFSYTISKRWYVVINQSLDVLSMAVSIFYIFRIMGVFNTWGTMLAELLCLLLVMKSYKLFTVGDFFMPLMMSVTLMVFSSLPSYSASYVISLFFFMVLLGFALYTSQLKESTRLVRKQGRRALHFTYRPTDYTDDAPLSNKSWSEIWPYLVSGLKASLTLGLIAFIACSFFFFQAERRIDEAKQSDLSMAFGGTLLNQSKRETISDDVLETPDGNNPGRGGGTLYPGFTEEFNIAQGRLASLNNPLPVMIVKTNVETYHRGRAFDEYTGYGWVQNEDYNYDTVYLEEDKTTGRGNVELNSEASKYTEFTIDPLTADKTIIRQTYTIAEGMPRTNYLFSGYQVNQLTLPYPIKITIDNEFNIRYPDASDVLPEGQSYEVESYKLLNPHKILSKQTYRREDFQSREFLDKYTQLPWDDHPGQFAKIKEYTARLLRGTPSQYDQVMKIIEHLRDNYHYSLEPPSVVPEGYDAVYFFLFEWEKKQGHCEYFASSFVVMARSVGIPCRVVTGYSPGDYSFNGFVVRQKNAHAWAEVYFPYIGWVEFDPTPPTPWYERGLAGTGGVALSVNNAIEELYVFNPGGYNRKHIRPKLYMAQRLIVRSSISAYNFFANTDREWLVDKMLANPIWWGSTLGLIALALMLFEVGYFVVLGPAGYRKRLIIKRGRGWLNKVEKILMKHGVIDEGYHTPSQIAFAALSHSGEVIPEPLEIYLRAKYNWTPPVYTEYWKMRRGFKKLIQLAKSLR